MKPILVKFFLSFLFIMSGTAYSQSGWVRQYPPSHLQDISFLSVDFVNDDTGFIVGGSGTIIHTTNGGMDWSNKISGTTNWLRGVSVVDVNTAIVVGDSGTILRTTNGGADWMNESSETLVNLNSITFTDANIGTVVGDSGTILRTTNGGTSWISQTSGTMNNLRGVSFINFNIGTAVGDSGTILRTTNGGITWTTQSISTDYSFGEVSFPDTNTGIVIGIYQHYPCITPCYDNGPRILRTTNGGISWENETPDRDSIVAFCIQCYPDPDFGVSFTDVNTGTVVLYNQVFHTTNGGGVLYTDSLKDGEGYWTRSLVDSNNFHGVCFTDANTGTVVGENGTIFHTTTGGITWVKDNPTSIPGEFVLEQNYPNPFNPTTSIEYQVSKHETVTLKIYDVLGNEIATLVNETKPPGIYKVNFDGSHLVSGVYFYRLQTESGFNAARKLLLLK